MMLRHSKIYVIATLLCLLAAPAFSEQEPSPQNTWDEYEVIVNKNIFSRNRWQQARRTAEQGRANAPDRARAPESFFVLRGITRDEDGFIAFIEDTRTYNMARTRVGDSVTEGTVKNMTLDHMAFELNGETRQIEIGMDLGGTAPQATSISPAAFVPSVDISPQVGTNFGKAAPSKEEAEDILKRLRERRQRELGE
jgi:hypothetical protein